MFTSVLDIKRQFLRQVAKTKEQNQKQKVRREARRAKGLCPGCGNKHAPQRKSCQRCLDIANKSWRIAKEWKMANNICVKCGTPKGENATKWFCRACADRQKEKTKISSLKKKGLTGD
jgi:hypothetical protein